MTEHELAQAELDDWRRILEAWVTVRAKTGSRRAEFQVRAAVWRVRAAEARLGQLLGHRAA